MKFLRSHFETVVDTENLSPKSFIAIATAACESLNWLIDYISPSGIVAHHKGFWSAKSNEITIRQVEGGIEVKSAYRDGRLVDWGKNKKLVFAFVDAFVDYKANMSDTDIDLKYIEVSQRFTDDEDFLAPETFNELNKNTGLLGLFKPQKGYAATPIIAAVNILVFIIMAASGVSILNPDTEAIYLWGGNYGPATLSGEYWRLFTCAFIHIGIMHLLVNMYGLIFAGALLEPILGTTRFVVAYILTAFTSSVLSLYMHPELVSAGASGAIFGLFGVLIAMLTTNLLHKQVRKSILPNLGIIVGYNLLRGMAPGIDNAGHIGGLIGGLIIGYSYYFALRKEANPKLKYIVTSLLCAATFIIIIVGIKGTVNPEVEMQQKISSYDEKMKKFSEFESMALEFYNHKSETKQDSLTEIKDRGLYYWDECINVLESIGKMDLPAEAVERNKIMLNYCALRREAYTLMYRQLEDNSYKFQPKIDNINQEIDSIVNSIKQ